EDCISFLEFPLLGVVLAVLCAFLFGACRTVLLLFGEYCLVLACGVLLVVLPLWVYIRELDVFGFLTFELFFLISGFCILELLGLTFLLTDSLVLLLFTLGALLFLETVLPLLTALLLEPWLLVCGALF